MVLSRLNGDKTIVGRAAWIIVKRLMRVLLHDFFKLVNTH